MATERRYSQAAKLDRVSQLRQNLTNIARTLLHAQAMTVRGNAAGRPARTAAIDADGYEPAPVGLRSGILKT